MKTPFMAADILNDRVLPFFESRKVPMLRFLTDLGTEYCAKFEQHDYQLYLEVDDIVHTKTKAKSPQTNGIVERFHRTILEEFYLVAFRKKIYQSMEVIQIDLDQWTEGHNKTRPHQGKICCGRTPMQTFIDGLKIVQSKMLEGLLKPAEEVTMN